MKSKHSHSEFFSTVQSKSQIKFSPNKLPDATLAKTVSTTEDDEVVEIRKRLQANGAFLV